jgi:hypothetical protein
MLLNEKYYRIGSGSSAWNPNATRAFVADSIVGPYIQLKKPAVGLNPHNGLGPDKTFGGQSSYIIPVQGKKDAYIAMFDIWGPEDLIKGSYIWLPFPFKDNQPIIQRTNKWNLSVFYRK